MKVAQRRVSRRRPYGGMKRAGDDEINPMLALVSAPLSEYRASPTYGLQTLSCRPFPTSRIPIRTWRVSPILLCTTLLTHFSSCVVLLHLQVGFPFGTCEYMYPMLIAYPQVSVRRPLHDSHMLPFFLLRVHSSSYTHQPPMSHRSHPSFYP